MSVWIYYFLGIVVFISILFISLATFAERRRKNDIRRQRIHRCLCREDVRIDYWQRDKTLSLLLQETL